MSQKLIEWFNMGEYYFTVNKKNKYNTTGKVELHTLDSVEPVLIGEFKIIFFILREKIERIIE